MVKIRPLAECKPLNWFYCKTVPNWLRPQDEHVAQNLCRSIQKSIWANTWNISKALSFLFVFFSPDSPREPWMDFDAQWLKTRGIMQGCAFLGSNRWLTTFRGSNFPNTGKNGLIETCSSRCEWIEVELRHRKWLHWRQWCSVAN